MKPNAVRDKSKDTRRRRMETEIKRYHNEGKDDESSEKRYHFIAFNHETEFARIDMYLDWRIQWLKRYFDGNKNTEEIEVDPPIHAFYYRN